MLKKINVFVCAICLLALALPISTLAQTVGLFFDSNVAQIKFAAGDIKTALESKKLKVEILPLSALDKKYSNKKVVIALTSDGSVTKVLTKDGGTVPQGLGEQAYALRTTTNTYWVLGGDANGAMYGGLQMAENIQFNGLSGTYNEQESPSILKRGIKLNLPFDVNSLTYFNANNSTSSRNSIAHVWDMAFWTTWFDEMARHRYNNVSVWNNHAFTSMIKLADYPDVVLNDVTGYPDIYNEKDKKGAVIKKMTIDEKIAFWRNVMAYAKSRGFSFYLFNWNLFLGTANNKYGMTEGKEGCTNPTTITYVRKCTYELLKTYPDLDGIGVTQGENMIKDDTLASYFLGATYGQGMADYAKENPKRKLNFIHRWHMAEFKTIRKNFKSLLECPNVDFDMSFKYSAAHMYSSTVPDFMGKRDMNFLKENKVKSWLTVRNDDFYYHTWGSVDYAREYLKNIPGQGDWFKGFYMGSDGFIPTRTFFSKNSVTQNTLEVQRQWYMYMIWGRLSYNPATSDNVFKNYLKLKYPSASSNDLFSAWSTVSKALSKVGELTFNKFKLDFHWYPESCLNNDDGLLTIKHFAAATPRGSSNMCSIENTASNSCANGKPTSYAVADQIEADAKSALAQISGMAAPDNSELGVTLNNVKAMSYLSIYYAYKIRGATYNKADKMTEAKEAMGTAYCWWMKYTNLMDANFKGMTCQRTSDFDTWHFYDAAVLKEYTDLGGVGTPNCTN